MFAESVEKQIPKTKKKHKTQYTPGIKNEIGKKE